MDILCPIPMPLRMLQNDNVTKKTEIELCGTVNMTYGYVHIVQNMRKFMNVIGIIQGLNNLNFVI